MANSSLRQYSTRTTPQTQRTPGRTDEVLNSAGGYVFAVDKWTRLNRWLILGSEGGSYYATESKLTFENLDAVMECIAEDGPRTVSIIVDISQSGRAPKNDQALFALAMCSAAADDKTRSAAFEALPQVARIGTHLFQFITYMEQFRKWGKGIRRAIGNWYTDQDPDKLALQLVKYRSRAVEGSMPWSHRDVLRKVHIDAKGHAETDNPQTRGLLAWAAGKKVEGRAIMTEADHEVFRVIEGFEKAQKAETPEEVASLVTTYRLPREAIPTELLNNAEVYAALLPHMGMTALIRNLATMTRSGLLTNMSDATRIAVDKLTDREALHKGRIHPITLLFALRTYQSGRSVRGSNTWTPVPRIVDALDDAFYASFDNVPATGKGRCIALDVSGSMSGSGDGSGWGGFQDIVPGLAPRVAAAAMSLVSMKTGDPYEIIAFTADSSAYGSRYSHYSSLPQDIPGVSVLSLSPRQRIDDICTYTEGLFPGATDCALPMVWASKKKRHEFDVFEVYTDNETFAGSIKPSQALEQYRQASGKDAKLIVVGMVSNGFSIADPRDPGMLDVVGFDTASPSIMSAFINGEL